MSRRLEELLAKANKGLTSAQIELGHSYLIGRDSEGNALPQDFEQAKHWLECAHERGASTATLLLGSLYEEGKGVVADAHKAIQYYELAAQQGGYLPCLYLARIYANGKGVDVSKELALAWYEKVLSHEGEVEGCNELEEAREYIRVNA